MKTWIDFNELREKLPFAEVLAGYNVEMTQKGTSAQYTGRCPLPSHPDAKGTTFSANYEKRVWQCFGCKAHGNILDLAVLIEGKNPKNGKDVRLVAAGLVERFLTKTDHKKTAPTVVPEKEKPRRTDESKMVVNQPLDFELKTLDAEHPCFAERKILPDTVHEFGLGFCKRGLLSGKIAVPLVDDARALVGYAGMSLENNGPRYLFPTSREHDDVKHVFERGRFLYNGYRIGKAVKDLIIVRECHSVWHLFQGGFVNVVGLMGNDCSDEQSGLISILTSDRARVWLLTDSTRESDDTAASFLFKVAPLRLCRWVKVKKDSDIAPEHPILAAIAKR
jgi:DNA primase